MKRYKHNLSHYHLTSFDMGQLVPVACMEVLPGDSFQQQTSALVRVTPQVRPLMHPVTVRIHHYYVPNRILWTGWEDFITGESETAPPTISGGAHSEGILSDYLGVYNDASNDFCALPIRAYNKIYNEYYRDQDLITEVSEDNNDVQRISWEKDYFTTARAWPQKGDAVTLPVGTQAPVTGISLLAPQTASVETGLYETGQSSTKSDTGWMSRDSSSSGNDTQVFIAQESGSYPNIYAQLSDAAALDIREFREAFALQRYQEARARYGSNYVDYLRYLGVRPSDARLQRPEYLGGGRQTIAFSEVLNTSNTNTGDLVGHGIAAMRTNRYRRFFEEHGWVLSLMSVRPKAIYVQGLPKKFSKTTKEQYYQKELEFVGAQEVYNRELYAAHTTPGGVFGYSPQYHEYRHEPSRVSSEFRNSTNYDWHMGRIFGSDPALNQTFIDCAPTKRVFADQTEDSLWVMVNNRIVARRLVKYVGVGGLV